MSNSSISSGGSNPPIRLAIVATPRSGNTWLRHLLCRYYNLTPVAFHTMTEQDWDNLPPDVALQIHHHRDPEFSNKLAERGFRVVTLARHPLDVLISILHFCIYDYETANWPGGPLGSEDDIRGAMPRSRPFLRYAAGPRAARLLQVTADWWQREGVISLRYENLVADPVAELQKAADVIGPPRCESPEELREGLAIKHLRNTVRNNHYWKGKPGLWKELLTAAEVREITPALEAVCRSLDYDCTPDPRLTAEAADARWTDFIGAELKETLTGWEGRCAAESRRAEAERRRADTERERADWERRNLEEERRQNGAATSIFQQVTGRLKEMELNLAASEERLAKAEGMAHAYHNLGGLPLWVANRLHAVRLRFPRAGALYRRLRGK